MGKLLSYRDWIESRDPSLVTYEGRLSRESEWAMSEGSRFFEGESAVQKALIRITRRLNELNIPYAVAGGMALFSHGYKRFTDDVDILVTREGLKAIHEAVDGRGWVRPFEKSKNLRDAEYKVKIEFLLTGDYPGDGKEKPVHFPEPQHVSVVRDGIAFLDLKPLVELKLASGISGADRMKDIADVQELIKVLSLQRSFGDDLNEYVRDKYYELYDNLRRSERRYVMLWRNKFLTVHVQSFDEMIQELQSAVDYLKQMREDGVVLDPEGGTADDYAHLVTSDPIIAKKYGMEDESEYFELDGEDEEEESTDDENSPAS